MSLLCLAHHVVRLWCSPRRWPRGTTNLVQIRWKSHVSFPLSWGRWPSLIRRNRYFRFLSRSLARSLSASLSTLSLLRPLFLLPSLSHTHIHPHTHKNMLINKHTHAQTFMNAHIHTLKHTYARNSVSKSWCGTHCRSRPMAWAILIMIRHKISFVGVAHLTRGGRSCSWALYRCLSDKAPTNKICLGTPWEALCAPEKK